MLQGEVLIRKLVAVDGLSTGSIMFGEVSTLHQDGLYWCDTEQVKLVTSAFLCKHRHSRARELLCSPDSKCKASRFLIRSAHSKIQFHLGRSENMSALGCNNSVLVNKFR
uniref:Uncharacterized protein n=1 Tax=Sinocyclocheilus grahami TaxID=75366 RepID=A0A672L2C7_SINGR